MSTRRTPTTTSPTRCGNVYVSGTYATPLTIAAANDVIVRPTLGGKLDNGSNDGSLLRASSSDATLGLIANNFVRVGHMVTRDTSRNCGGNVNTAADPIDNDVAIDAAILSLQHSFIADNYDCGRLGTLTVVGAIAQKYRGPVGTGLGRQHRHRVRQGLHVRRPVPLPLPAVLPEPGRLRLGRRALARAGPGPLTNDSSVPIVRSSLCVTSGYLPGVSASSVKLAGTPGSTVSVSRSPSARCRPASSRP